jgi:Cd2+/Zn2+-exporting ATPase
MGADLRKLPHFIRRSRDTYPRLLQNITLVLGINAVFLVLTLMGRGTRLMVVLVDVGGSPLVVGNGLRLLRKSQLRRGGLMTCFSSAS